MKLDSYINGNKGVNYDQNQNVVSSGVALKIKLLDNPFEIDSTFSLKFYINNKLYYKGSFSSLFLIKAEFTENELCNCRVELYKNNTQYILTNKETFNWNYQIRQIYYTILLSESSSDNTVFIPTTNPN